MINKKTKVPLIYEYITKMLVNTEHDTLAIIKAIMPHIPKPTAFENKKYIDINITQIYYNNMMQKWGTLKEIKTYTKQEQEKTAITFVESLEKPERILKILKEVEEKPANKNNIKNFIIINGKNYPLDEALCYSIYKINVDILQNKKEILDHKGRMLSLIKKIKPIIKTALQLGTEKQTKTKEAQLFELIRIVIKPESIPKIIDIAYNGLFFPLTQNRKNPDNYLPYEARLIDVTKNIGEGVFCTLLEQMTEKQFNYCSMQIKKTEDSDLLPIQNLFEQYKMIEFRQLLKHIGQVYSESTTKNKKSFMKNIYKNLLQQEKAKNLLSEKEEEKYIFQQDWATVCLKLGSFFVNLFIENNFLKIQLATKDEKKSYTKVVLLTNSNLPIILPSSFIKPKLETKEDTPIINMSSHMALEDDAEELLTKGIKCVNNSKFVIKEKGQECLHNLDVKYTINSPFYQEYLQELKKLTLIDFECIFDKPQSIEAEEVQRFIMHHYNINLNIKIQNECSMLFLRKIVSSLKDFSTTITQYMNKKLLLKLSRTLSFLIKIHSKDNIKTKITWITIQDNENTDDTLKELFTLKSETRLLISLIDKTTNRKDFLKNLLEDLSIYQYFDHFYLEKTITGVGRLGIKPFYINYITDKVSRAFIFYKTNEKEISEALFYDYHKIISKMLPHVSSDELKALTYTKFKQQTDEEQKVYISSFFIDINLSELIEKKIKTFSKLLKYVKCRNNNTAILGLSVLYYYLNANIYLDKEPIVYMDSSMNGTQLFAILFNNKNAATYSNLIGDTKFDLNLDFLDHFDKCLNSLSFFSKISKEFFNLNINDLKIKKPVILLSVIYNKLNKDIVKIPNYTEKFFTSFDNAIDHFLKYNLNTLPENYIKSFQEQMSPDTLDQVFTLINYKTYPLFTKWKENPLLQHCLLILLSNSIQQMTAETPGFLSLLKYREVIKTRLLAAQYGMQDAPGRNCICKSILDVAAEKGILISTKYAFCLAEYLSCFFIYYFSKKIIPYQKLYCSSAKLIKNPITFINKFFSVKLRPQISKKYTLNLTFNKKRHQVTCATTFKIFDLQKYQRSFAPCWIHFMEATLMFNFIHKCIFLHKKLSPLGLNFFYSHIYDNFGSNFIHIVFLKHLIKECYYDVANEHFCEQLLNSFNNNSSLIAYLKKELIQKETINGLLNPFYWPVDITGKFFVKY